MCALLHFWHLLPTILPFYFVNKHFLSIIALSIYRISLVCARVIRILFRKSRKRVSEESQVEEEKNSNNKCVRIQTKKLHWMWVKKQNNNNNNAMNQQHQIIGLKTEKLWWNDGKLSRNKAHTNTHTHSHSVSQSVTRSRELIYTHAHWRYTHTHTHQVKMYCKYKIFWSWRRLTISMFVSHIGVFWVSSEIVSRFFLSSPSSSSYFFATLYIDFCFAFNKLYILVFMVCFFHFNKMKQTNKKKIFIYRSITSITCIFFPGVMFMRTYVCVDILNLMALFFLQNAVKISIYIFFKFYFFLRFEKALWS